MTYKEFINNILKNRGRFGIPKDTYKERHHIIPICMGGDSEENNLIDLYAKEHFIAHKLLAIENPDNYGCVYAWIMMAYRKSDNQEREYEITPDEYEELRKLCSQNASKHFKKLWENPDYVEKMKHRKSYERTAQHRQRLSECNKGKIVSEETRNKISKKNKGRKRTEEFKKRISECSRGSNNGMYGKTYTQEVKDALSKQAHEQHKDSKWWNNGITQVFQKDCPEGYTNGRLPFKEDNKAGKYEHKKGLKRPKYKYIDEYGNIQYMDAFNQKRWHPDWKLVSEVEEGGDNND